ncbi:MAG: hypothetical protein P8P90_00570 [Opitutales bacterium]|nr:hypothetical protein [Opitutales bacterium]
MIYFNECSQSKLADQLPKPGTHSENLIKFPSQDSKFINEEVGKWVDKLMKNEVEEWSSNSLSPVHLDENIDVSQKLADQLVRKGIV